MKNMNNQDVLKCNFIRFLDVKNTLERNQTYNTLLHEQLQRIIRGAMYSLRVSPASIGSNNYDDIQQDILLSIFTKFNSPESLDQVRELDNYIFILSKYLALKFLRHLGYQQRLENLCDEVGEYLNDNHRLIL